MVIAARIQLLPALIDVTHVFAFSGAGGVLATFIAAALRLPPDRLARLTVLGNLLGTLTGGLVFLLVGSGVLS